jgi:hypothetical protein
MVLSSTGRRVTGGNQPVSSCSYPSAFAIEEPSL